MDQQKCLFPLGDPDPRLTYGSSDPHASAPKTASRSVHPCAQQRQTDKQTHTARYVLYTSVAIRRIYALRAGHWRMQDSTDGDVVKTIIEQEWRAKKNDIIYA